MSATAPWTYRIANRFYKGAYPIYRPVYNIFKAYTDRAERRLIRRILPPGAIVVDAGANVGTYTAFFARCVGQKGTVHSFEPAPENFRRLFEALSHLPNVRLNELALSDKTGESLLYLSDELNVDHRAYPAEDISRRAISMRMMALDDYFRPGQRVDLIKMDIQGYEFHALRGAQRVLKENPEIQLLLEFWPYALEQAGTQWKQLIEMLQGLCMDVALVRSEGLIPFQAGNVRIDSSWYVNLFASRGAKRSRAD